MHCNDTITCAITPGAGRVVPTTASVFKTVRKDEWDAGCNQRNVGCQRESTCGCGNNCANNCETTFGGNCNTTCSRNNSCQRESTCGCGNSCDNNCETTFGCNRNTDCSRNNSCQRENDCGCANTCDNDCGNNCETTFGRNRNTDCGCNNTCQCETNGGCNNSCECETTCNTDCSCHHHRHGHHHGWSPAMVYEAEHDLSQLHEAEEAIRKGTLFPQLYMPMKGECADACGAQLCEDQAEAFAAWELRLYLNTHPCDQQALKLFRQLARKTRQPNYATSFAQDCDEGWRWTDAPWPWEFNCGCE